MSEYLAKHYWQDTALERGETIDKLRARVGHERSAALWNEVMT